MVKTKTSKSWASKLIAISITALLATSSLAADFKTTSAAAEKGEATAQFALGQMYDFGDGIKQDFTKAVEWYLKAGEQGNADAQFSLGVAYAEGDGVTKDKAKLLRVIGAMLHINLEITII